MEKTFPGILAGTTSAIKFVEPYRPSGETSVPRSRLRPTLAKSNFGQSIFGHRVLPANFGQSIFGQNYRLVVSGWPILANRILANPFLANPFSCVVLWLVLVWVSVLCWLFFQLVCVVCVLCVVVWCCVVCVVVWCCVLFCVCCCVCVCVCVWFVLCGSCGVCCCGCGSYVWCGCWFGPPSAGPPKISLFFSPLPPQFSFFSHSFVGPFVEFWWCLQRRGAQMCTALGLLCETPAASGPSGLHTTTRELQTCTFDGPGASKHHHKTTRRTHNEREKERNWWDTGRRGPTLRSPHPSGPIYFGPHFFLGLGPTPFGAPP